MLRLIIGCVVIAFAHCLNAQVDLDQSIRFPNTEVLETTAIRKIVEGPFGFIWIATDQALFRFDGSLLTPVFHGEFEDIDIDESNDQFVFTSREDLILYSYLGHKTEVIPKASIVEGDYILQTTVVLNDSVYIVGSGFGLSVLHLDKGVVNSLQFPGPDNRHAEVTAGERDPLNPNLLWFGTKAGLFSYEINTGDYERHWLESEGDDHELKLNLLDALYIHSNGKIFLGSWGAGLAIYDPATGLYDHDDEQLSKRLNSHVYSIIPESDSTVWISSTTGAVRYNTRNGKRESHLNTEVIEDPVLDLGPVMIDKMGRYWIGYVHGLRILDPNKSQIEIIDCPLFTNERFYIPTSVSQGKEEEILHLGVNFGDGLYTFDLNSKQWRCYGIQGRGRDFEFRISDTYWEGDTLWILDGQGLFYFIEGSTSVKEFPLNLENQSYRFRSFARIAQDKMWVVSNLKGLYEVRPSSGDITHFSEINALSEMEFLQKVRHLLVDKSGNAWLGFKDRLYLYLTGEARFIDITRHVNNGQPFLDINFMYVDESGFWVATKAGVFRVRNIGGDEFSSRRYTEDPANSIVTINNEELWITTGHSITKIDIENGSSRRFNKTEGLPEAGKNGFDRIDQLADGRIFLSGRREFGLFYPDDLETRQESPMPYFAHVYVDGIETTLSGLGLSLSYLEMDPDQNSVAIDFSAISYSSQINNRFRYKLEGINEDWIVAGTGSEGPTYTNLPGGSYRFLVEAAGSEEDWGAPAIIELKVSEHWWQKTWFHLLMAMASIGLLLAIYRARVNSVRRNSETQYQILNLEKKALQAQMNPHFIFNAMNSIQNLIAKGDEKNAMFYLNRFGKLLRSVLDNSNNSYVNLSSEVAMLDNYILLESLRFRGTFKYEIVVDPSLEYSDIKVPGFIVQPIVENAIQHGLIPKKSGGELKLILKDENTYVDCIVEDNGVGRSATAGNDKNEGSESVGLKILNARLKLYDQVSSSELILIEDLFSEDGRPAGTRVNLKLPIQN